MEAARKATRILGGMAAVVAVGLFCQNAAFASPSGGSDAAVSDQTVMQQLHRASDAVNKSLPRMVDQITRLDGTAVGPGKLWTYTYTIVSPLGAKLTQQMLDKYMKPKVMSNVCSKMKVFVDHGVVVKYLYDTKDGGLIGSLVIEPSDCGA